MCDVVKEVSKHVPESFLRHYIFLPAYMAITTLHNSAAVQTILLFSLRDMRHSKIFLKNKYKKYKLLILFRY